MVRQRVPSGSRHIKGQNYTAVMHFAGDCETVLALAVRFALAQLLQLLL